MFKSIAIAATLALATSAAAAPPSQSPARFDWFDYRGDDGHPKPGVDQYANPILQGFYPDPSITRVGDDYYLVNSTFAWFPGIPVFHSRDLVNWTQIGNAIDRPGQLNFDTMTMWQGVYAPDISFHDGKFYILNTCTGCGGNFVITATDPAGPWSDPVWLPKVDGIDTSFFFDDDGSAWIVHNGPPEGKPRYDGHTAIWLQKFDTATMQSVGEPRVLVDSGVHPDRNPIWIEGPHIFKKDGFYYLIAAEGGTEEGHSEVVFRSDRLAGPYVPGPVNPILTQRDLPKDRPNPITSTGHAGFVQTANDQWWATFLGVRPYDSDNNFNTGRETFLLPVAWKDGWPLILPSGTEVPWVAKRADLPLQPSAKVPLNGAFDTRDDFNGPKLPTYWMGLRNPKGGWWKLANGSLVIDPKPEAFTAHGNPSLLARRQQHQNFTATTRLVFDPANPDAEAGLIAMQNDEHYYFLAVGRDGSGRVVRLRSRTNEGDPAIGNVVASARLPGASTAPVSLRVDGRSGSYDFSWSGDGKTWHKLASNVDGTMLSTKRAGGFVGAIVGLYAHSESAK